MRRPGGRTTATDTGQGGSDGAHRSGGCHRPAAALHDEAEAALVARAVEGDRDALMTLLERHTPTLRAVIARRIPSRWRALLSADDVIQQTYVDAFLNIGRFEPQRGIGFEQWLMALAKYNLLDALRMFWAEKRGGRRQRVEPASREESFSTLYEALGGVTQTTPSRVAARREACDVMRAAIAQLPESYRCVVEMYDIEGRPIQEVAARLRRSPGAVYMLHARAHRMLAGMLGSSSQYLTG